MKQLLRNVLLRAAHKTIRTLSPDEIRDYGKGLSHRRLHPNATYSPWDDNPQFLSLYNEIRLHTLVDLYRCYELYTLCAQIQDMPGDLLEVGVWKGGTAKLMRKFVSGGSTLYLADTFSGVVKASEKDSYYKGGEHSDTTEKIVHDLLGADANTNTVFLKGIFPDDTGGLVRGKSFKFVHIDVDTHDSARDSFFYIWDKMLTGGIVVFDDYGFNGCEGVTLFFNGLHLENALKLYNINGHGIIIKI